MEMINLILIYRTINWLIAFYDRRSDRRFINGRKQLRDEFVFAE